MAITTQRYIRKPLYVDAVRITAANFEEIAAWCDGQIQQEDVPGKGTSKKFIRVRVQNPKNPRQTKAMVGDWLLYTETGYKVYTVKAFHAAFDKVENHPLQLADGVDTPATPIEEVAEMETVVNRGLAREVVSGSPDNKVPDGLMSSNVLQLHEEGKLIHEIADILNVTQAQVREVLAAEPPKYPTPQLEEATPEGIADAILQNEEARKDLEIPPEEPGKVEPSAVEGRRVLSEEEQRDMTSDEVRELVQSGDVVLAQDIAHP